MYGQTFYGKSDLDEPDLNTFKNEENNNLGS